MVTSEAELSVSSRPQFRLTGDFEMKSDKVDLGIKTSTRTLPISAPDAF